MNTEKARCVFRKLNPRPINEVLPEDLIQHVLSFGHCNQNRTVCPEWNRLNIKNEQNVVRKLNHGQSLRPNQKIWIMHATRPKLTAMEEHIACDLQTRYLKRPLRNWMEEADRYIIVLRKAREHLKKLKAKAQYFGGRRSRRLNPTVVPRTAAQQRKFSELLSCINHAEETIETLRMATRNGRDRYNPADCMLYP